MSDGTTIVFGLPRVAVNRVEQDAGGVRTVHLRTIDEKRKTRLAQPVCGRAGLTCVPPGARFELNLAHPPGRRPPEIGSVGEKSSSLQPEVAARRLFAFGVSDGT